MEDNMEIITEANENDAQNAEQVAQAQKALEKETQKAVKEQKKAKKAEKKAKKAEKKAKRAEKKAKRDARKAEKKAKKAEKKANSGEGNGGKKSAGRLSVVILSIVCVLLIVAVGGLGYIMYKENKKNADELEKLSATVATLQVANAEYKEQIEELEEEVDELDDFRDDFEDMVGEDYEQEASSENDVTIGGMYRIESTEHLSDAYLSGDLSSLTEDERETVELAAAVIDEVITDDMTDYEKELAIYDWMYENITCSDGITSVIPILGDGVDNPQGVLKSGEAVCVGFATTFRFFMQMLDIECMVVHDVYLSHSWNLVNIEGGWYHCDLYMDNGSTKYASFNMTDDICYQSHEWDMEFFPNAVSTEYCYIMQSAVEFVDLETSAKEIREMLEARKTAVLSYKVVGDTYNDIEELDALLYEIDSLLMGTELGENGWLYWEYYALDEESMLFTISYEYYDWEEDDWEDDDWEDDWGDDYEVDYDKVYDVMEDVFGDFAESNGGVSYDDFDEDYYEDYDGDIDISDIELDNTTVWDR